MQLSIASFGEDTFYALRNPELALFSFLNQARFLSWSLFVLELLSLLNLIYHLINIQKNTKLNLQNEVI